MRDSAASDAALTGDGYGWLATVLTETLPAAQAPTCETCGSPLTLPATAPVLWSCAHCHPEEAR